MSENLKTEDKKAEPVSPQPTPTPAPETETPEAKQSEKPEAPPYKAIVVTDTCGFCAGLKDYINGQGLGDKVKIINASTPEGRKFAIDNKIKGVPECVVVDQGGKQVKVCSKEEFVKLLKEGT